MSPSQPKQFVIIEDSPGMSEMLIDFLIEKFPGSDVAAYATGEEALFKLKQAPDAFILDYNLNSKYAQALNGIQVMMKLKNKFSSPIIIFSAQEREDVEENLKKFGAYSYVKKDEVAFEKLYHLLSEAK